MQNPDLGIIYVNSSHENQRYVREAEESAKSFRRYFPSATFELHTDATDFQSEVFDRIVPARFELPDSLVGTDHKNGQMVAKLGVLARSAYPITLYLGADTYALDEKVATLPSLMQRFDFALAHAPHRINRTLGDGLTDIPECYPEFNCDLVLYRQSEGIRQLLEEWERRYLTQQPVHAHDQGAFRWLAYHSDLRIATLSDEYNYRGQAFRKDVVVLQNRDTLPQYLSSGAPRPAAPTRNPLPVRLGNRILGLCGSRFRLRPTRSGEA